MPSIQDLLIRNFSEVMNERDAARRRAAIEALYSADATVAEADRAAEGWDGVDDVVRGVQEGAPGMTFSVGEPSVIEDLGRVAWQLVPEAGGDPVVRGTDIALVRDGRIHRIYTFVDAPTG
jgi:hypothetical protein